MNYLNMGITMFYRRAGKLKLKNQAGSKMSKVTKYKTIRHGGDCGHTAEDRLHQKAFTFSF